MIFACAVCYLYFCSLLDLFLIFSYFVFFLFFLHQNKNHTLFRILNPVCFLICPLIFPWFYTAMMFNKKSPHMEFFFTHLPSLGLYCFNSVYFSVKELSGIYRRRRRRRKKDSLTLENWILDLARCPLMESNCPDFAVYSAGMLSDL